MPSTTTTGSSTPKQSTLATKPSKLEKKVARPVGAGSLNSFLGIKAVTLPSLSSSLETSETSERLETSETSESLEATEPILTDKDITESSLKMLEPPIPDLPLNTSQLQPQPKSQPGSKSNLKSLNDVLGKKPSKNKPLDNNIVKLKISESKLDLIESKIQQSNDEGDVYVLPISTPSSATTPLATGEAVSPPSLPLEHTASKQLTSEQNTGSTKPTNAIKQSKPDKPIHPFFTKPPKNVEVSKIPDSVKLEEKTKDVEKIKTKETHKREEPVKQKPLKQVHPFFNEPLKNRGALHKPKPSNSEEKEEAISTKVSTNPTVFGSQTKPVSNDTIKSTPIPSKSVTTFSSSSFSKPFSSFKRKSGKEAPWPKLDQMHVRGFDSFEISESFESLDTPSKSTILKPKHHKPFPASASSFTIQDPESLLTRLYTQTLDPFLLNYKKISTILRDPQFFPIPPIRIPEKLALSPAQAKSIIKCSITDPTSLQILTPLLDKIPYVKPAFQESKSETKMWSQKYEPLLAKEVVTAGFKGVVVREWIKGRIKKLQELKNNRSSYNPKRLKKRGRKPKRKRMVDDDDDYNDLDGFIVDDDEIEYENSDHSDETMVDESSESKNNQEVNDLIDATRSINSEILILCGPPGSGKTSSVYAACKELDIYVFEINPSERRTGKIVMEKLEGMSNSHLVHSSKNKSASFFGTIKQGNDRKSGLANNTNDIGEKSNGKNRENQPSEKQPKKESRQQKSVVLLDEADILFDEESSFWPAILEKFLVSTRRPVIITCSDPSNLSPELLARYNSNGEAMLDIEPSPAHVQVDVLWAIAFSEGHYLDKGPLYQLVNECCGDFRKAVNQLQFWCQMGLGDRLSGIHWYLMAKEINNELDGQGRLISKGTFIGIGNHKPEYPRPLDVGLKHEESKISLNILGNFDKLDKKDLICPPPFTNYKAYSEDLLSRLEVSPCSTDSKKEIPLKAWADLCDAFSVADILQTHSHSLFAADEISINLLSIAEEVEEIPVPQDYIIGDRYPSDVNTLVTQKCTEPLSFENLIFPDLLKLACNNINRSISSEELPKQTVVDIFPVTFSDQHANSFSTKLRCLYSPLTLTNPYTFSTTIPSNSYTHVTTTHTTSPNSIDTVSAGCLVTQISPFIRLLAQADLKKEDIIEAIVKAAKSKNIAEQTKKPSLASDEEVIEDVDMDMGVGGDVGASSNTFGLSSFPNVDGAPSTFSHFQNPYQPQPNNFSFSEKYQHSVSAPVFLHSTSSTSSSHTTHTTQQPQTRKTMRAVYASLGHSAAEVLALTRRYLPDTLDLSEVIRHAPNISKTVAAEAEKKKFQDEDPSLALDRILEQQRIDNYNDNELV